MAKNGKLLRKGNQASSRLCEHICSRGPGLGGANFVGGEIVYAFRKAQCLLGISTRFLDCTLTNFQGKQTPSISMAEKESCVYGVTGSQTGAK